MMTYIIYFSALFLSIIFAKLSSKKFILKNKPLKFSFVNLILSLSIISLLVGLRNESVGTDTIEYIKEYFANYNTFYFDFFKNSTEPGHSFFAFLLNQIQAGKTIYLLFFSTLSLVFFYSYYIDKKELLPWSIYFAFCVGYIFVMMNGMRQAVAMPIIGLSIRYIVNRNVLKFIGLILLASIFHYSAFLLLPIYYVNYLSKIKFKYWLILFLVSVLLSAHTFLEIFKTVLPIFPKDYTHYLDKIITTDSKFGFGFLFHIILSIITLYFSSKVTFDKSNRIILNLYFLGVILMNVTYQIPILQRFNIYLMFFQIPIMSYIAYNLYNCKQFTSIAFISIIYFLGFISKIITQDSNCCPYILNF